MNKCPLCKSNKHELIYTNSRGEKYLENYCCISCGFIFVKPRIQPEDVDNIYKKGNFSKSARGSIVPDLKKFIQTETWALERVHILERKIPNFFKKENNCLEIGSGASSFSWLLKNRGQAVECIEPDIEYSKVAADRYNLNIIPETFDEFKNNKKYNFVCSFHVIEHVIDPFNFINKTFEILEDKGIIYIECPTIDNIYTKNLNTFFWDVHINTFSNITLPYLLEQCGFEIIDSFEHRGFLVCIGKKVQKAQRRFNKDDNNRIKNIIAEFNKKNKIKNISKTILSKKIFQYSAKKALNLLNKIERINSNETKTLPYINKPIISKTNQQITHLSAFTYGNAGDTILPLALQDTWNFEQKSIKWKNQHVYPTVDNKMVDNFNKSKGIIIGGGGLFLKDTNKNNISGWQWPCSIEMIKKIKTPIILFAVGYNRFRGQEEFEPYFKENIVELTKKSVYIGLRNHGSINAVKNYLPKEMHSKLRFQPCMTTFLSKLYPDLCNYSEKENFVAINTAFDRSELRFGDKLGETLTNLAKAIKTISAKYPIKFYSHMPSDDAFIPFLKAFKIKYEIIKLNSKHPAEIIKEYAKPKLVIGMRGHAQMVPFGCKTPIVSIVSHNKLQWFLDDIDKPNWGVDVNSNNFQKELEERAFSSLNNTFEEIKFIEKKQNELFEISLKNVNDGLEAFNIK